MRQRFASLVNSFPVLQAYAPGVTLNNVDLILLDAWAAHDPAYLEQILMAGRSPFPGFGAQCAARFVLHLWDSRRQWRCGPFDLFASLQAWDDEQLRAWQAWAAAPWRP